MCCLHHHGLFQSCNRIKFKSHLNLEEFTPLFLLLPVSNLMSSSDAEIKTCIFCNNTIPLARTDSAQLGHASHLFIPIGQN